MAQLVESKSPFVLYFLQFEELSGKTAAVQT